MGRRVRVGVSFYRALEPVDEILAPPQADTFPDDEADVGVEYGTKEIRLDLLPAMSAWHFTTLYRDRNSRR